VGHDDGIIIQPALQLLAIDCKAIGGLARQKSSISNIEHSTMLSHSTPSMAITFVVCPG
jgi:hypothetical protein